MTHLSLKLGSIGAVAACVSFFGVLVATPQPAGACDCIVPRIDLELVDVVLVNPGDRDDATVAALEDEEAAAWPETASHSDYVDFYGYAGEQYISIDIEVE